MRLADWVRMTSSSSLSVRISAWRYSLTRVIRSDHVANVCRLIATSRLLRPACLAPFMASALRPSTWIAFAGRRLTTLQNRAQAASKDPSQEKLIRALKVPTADAWPNLSCRFL